MLQKLALAFLLTGYSSSLAAQSQPSWGVEDASTYAVAAWDMQASSSSVTWDIDISNGHRRLTGGGEGSLMGVAHLPQGVQIVSMALEACDFSDVGGINAILTRTTLTGAGSHTLATASTGSHEDPGCVHVSTDLATPETVENNANRYLVIASSEVFGPTAPTIGGVRIRYRLQVSPPPADPTFGDLPTSDPAFQFVEALVASGITVGCGGGNYCPDEPLTRRQMAVFLAKALGLHWPDGPLF
jgi:hypothetical protein